MSRITLKVHPDDNVVTLLDSDDASRLTIDGLDLLEAIPFGHKAALCAIPAGACVIKYGVAIGVATRSIARCSRPSARRCRTWPAARAQAGTDMTPAPALALHLERLATPIGTLLVVSDDRGVLRAVDWDDHLPRFHRLLQRHYGRAGHVLDERPATRFTSGSHSAACDALRAYFAGDLAAIDRLAVATNGTPFQQAVWQALRGIAPGRTITYSDLAERSGRPAAVRAAGFANGQNPVGIVVPCHRVIGRDGTLTGYGGGLHRKQWLLRHEGARPG